MIKYCNAKINLTLDMTGLRDDGYHLLRSVMHPIPLCDVLAVERSLGISLECSIKEVPVDESNLVVKAARLFFNQTGIKGGMKAYLKKNIPFGAGLGGGSSDAANTLIALNELYDYGADANRLKEWAMRLGADVPFFIDNKPALAEGIGELLTPCTPLPPCLLLLIKPDFSVNTKEAYELLGDYWEEGRTDSLVSAINQREWNEISRWIGNGMQKCIAARYPEIEDICNIMKEKGAFVSSMTGSGSAVFGLFPLRSDISALKEMYKNYFVFDGELPVCYENAESD